MCAICDLQRVLWVIQSPLTMHHVALHRPHRCKAAAAPHLQLVAQRVTVAARLQRMQRTTRCPTYSSSGEQLAGTL